MKTHIKVYLKHFDLGEQDLCTCEVCTKMGRIDNGGFDIHHIWGRGKDKDVIENLMCVCRRCHTEIHSGMYSKSMLQYIHNNYLNGHKIKFRK